MKKKAVTQMLLLVQNLLTSQLAERSLRWLTFKFFREKEVYSL